MSLFSGCSLHSHAGGGRYQDPGTEQRREARALLHAGHSDLKKGKGSRKMSKRPFSSEGQFLDLQASPCHRLLRECGGARPAGFNSRLLVARLWFRFRLTCWRVYFLPVLVWASTTTPVSSHYPKDVLCCDIFLPLTQWLLWLTPAAPTTLFRNERWLRKNWMDGWMNGKGVV